MIIISQDKLQIFNIETAKNIWIEEEEVEINQIEQTAYLIYIDGEISGSYLTEERAKEVLQEIIKAYLDCNEQNHLAEFAYVKNKAFEMPKE